LPTMSSSSGRGGGGSWGGWAASVAEKAAATAKKAAKDLEASMDAAVEAEKGRETAMPPAAAAAAPAPPAAAAASGGDEWETTSPRTRAKPKPKPKPKSAPSVAAAAAAAPPAADATAAAAMLQQLEDELKRKDEKLENLKTKAKRHAATVSVQRREALEELKLAKLELEQLRAAGAASAVPPAATAADSAEVERLQELNTSMEAEVAASASRVDCVKRMAKESIAKMGEKVKRLEAQLEQERVDAMQRDTEQLERREAQSVQDQAPTDADRRVAELEQEVAFLMDEAAARQAELDNSASSNELLDAVETAEQLESEREELRLRCEVLQASLAEASSGQDAVGALQAELAAKAATVEKVKTMARERCAKLSGEKKAARQDLGVAQAKIEKLESQLSTGDTLLGQMEAQLSSGGGTDESERNLSEARSQIEALQAQLSAAESRGAPPVATEQNAPSVQERVAELEAALATEKEAKAQEMLKLKSTSQHSVVQAQETSQAALDRAIAAEAQVVELEGQLAALSISAKQVDPAQRKAEKRVKQLEMFLKEAKDTLRRTEEAYVVLQGEGQGAEGEAVDLRKQQKEALAEVAAMRTEAQGRSQTHAETLAAVAAQRGKLEHELQATAAGANAARQRDEVSTRKVQKLERLQTDMESESAELKVTAASRQQEIEALRHELAELKRAGEQIQESASAQHEHREQLGEEVETAQREVLSLTNQIAAARADAEQELAALRDELARVRQEKAAAQRELEEERQGREAEAEMMHAALTLAERKVTDAMTAKAEALETLKLSRTRAEQALRRKEDAANDTVASVRQQAAAHVDELAESKATLLELRSKLAGLSERTAAYAQLEGDKAKLRKEVIQFRVKAEAATAEASASTYELQEARASAAELETLLQAERDQAGGATVDSAKQADEVVMLRSEVARLSTAVATAVEEGAELREQLMSVRLAQPEGGAATAAASEQERDPTIQLDYIKNVVVKFLEHQDDVDVHLPVLGQLLRMNASEINRIRESYGDQDAWSFSLW